LPVNRKINLSPPSRRCWNGEFAPVLPEVWLYNVSGLTVEDSWLGYRMNERHGKKSSPPDDIRPQSWTAALTDELLEVLWTPEKTLELEPQAEALLREVLPEQLVNAAELPTPTLAERAAAGDGNEDDEQAPLDT
jgi:hypothetical protein